MNTALKILVALSLALSFGLAAADEDQAQVRRAVAEGRLRPLSEIMAQVQAQYPGRVMDVELERDRNGRYVYEIEMLGPDRRRFEIKVDGATGQLIEPGAGAGTGTARSFHPLPDLLRQVLQAHPGYVIDVELEDGQYQVEVVANDGSHVQVVVDPRAGGILRSESRVDLSRLRPMPEVLDAVLARYPGTVLDAELERGIDGSYYYEFEIEDGRGRQHALRVDAFSGEILHEEED